MGTEHRRVVAESPDRAWALAQNLGTQGFEVVERLEHQLTMVKRRRRGDITVTIRIVGTGPAGGWAPPAGPRHG